MKESQTPLMKQYNQIKEKYPETVLLYRLGDFFETFGDDAVITAKVCGITLTKRNNGAGDMPLAGFPHHQLDAYLPKLVRGGYRVAVCEQLEDPKAARGIVKRGVVEVVTPGVALYDKLLDTKSNNYVAVIFLKTEKNGFVNAGFSACDISTGEFLASEIPANKIIDTLNALVPAEIIVSKSQKNEIADLLSTLSFKPAITKLEEWIFDYSFTREHLLKHFKTHNLKGFGIEEQILATITSGALLNYISETQRGRLEQIKSISIYDTAEFMTLDYATRRNLEILYSMNDNQNGTLISILDKTSTASGGRLFKKWISLPLKNLESIHQRLNAVKSIYDDNDSRELLRNLLSQIGDIERLISKICSGRANPRDCVSLKNSLKIIPKVKELLINYGSYYLKTISNNFDDLKELVSLIENTLVEEPSVNMGTGNVFHSGFNSELDEYVEAKFSGKNWIAEYQEDERQKSGINTLKVGFTSVFGYYIEVSKLQSSKVPDYYQRKQTLTNAERYTTPEIKKMEEKIFGAEEKILELESRLFGEIKNQIINYTSQIQKTASLISIVDCLQSFASASIEFNYVMPEIDDSNVIEIIDGRHPVVENLLPIGTSFTPNSLKLSNEDEQIHIITGPNMSGKSCYLRQAALIVLLGQIGCFVPAKSAKFGLIDRIFTRVGASDNITAGESTFLVEMQEAANILNNATSHSLILLDEVGRGTATFDGISIAWSITEYIHNNIGAKTLFATHYHELNDLAERYSRIKNYKVEVVETGSNIIFTHKVVCGASDFSFGIHVAKMAGLPYYVIERADEIMLTLEDNSSDTNTNKTKPDIKSIKTKKQRSEDQLAIFEIRDDAIREKIQNLKIENITPIQALNLLTEFHSEIKKKVY